MFYFNLKETAIFQAVKWEPVFRFFKFLKKIFLVLFIFTFLIFLYGFLRETFFSSLLSVLLGLSIIFLIFTIFSCLTISFFNSKFKNPKLKVSLEEVILSPEKFNLAEFLNLEVARAVSKSIKFAKSKRLPEINSTILFYFLLKDNPKLNFIFSRALLNLEEIKKILQSHFRILKPEVVEEAVEVKPQQPYSISGMTEKIKYSEDFQKTIFEVLKFAQETGKERIETGEIIVALAKYNPVFKKILIEANLKIEDLKNLISWLKYLEKKIEKQKRFWEYENLVKKGSLAKEWAAGYTITLDQYSIDWTDFIKKRGFEEIIGHKSAVEQMERVLARSEINNVLLVGEPGSGRGATIQALTQRILFGQSLANLNYKRVVELDMPSLISQIESSEEVGAVLDQIFREVIFAGNIILVINEFHNYIGQLLRPGIIDISGVLIPYLKSPQFQIVTVTTFLGLHKYIEQNPSILSLFEKVEISEISAEETIKLLENLALTLEKKYQKFVSYPAIREIVNYSKKYLPAIPFPKKAIDLLDEIMVYLVGETKDQVLLPEHVAKVISEKIQIPVGKLEIRERETLLNLENLIHRRIINQEEAVSEISAAIRRARAEVTIRKGPMGCFLFLGPTGVGKTETSKALAEIYFHSEDRMIRLDMSEFQDTRDIPRLIGSPGEEGLLTTKVRETPFSLILLDEIEKAHPNILNLFLQVFDEGHLTDGLGRKVDFKNSIIIATSNAGAEIIWKDIKLDKKLDIVKDDLLSYLFEKAIFRPEFINRFDGVIIFKPLTKENLLDIAELLLQKLKKNLEEKNIEFVITLPLKEKIVELSYNPVFGAREMKRVIQDRVENVLASALLSGRLKRGNKAEIKAEGFELLIS